MKFIFTGTPTKREILLFLKNRKYSLLNKVNLKRDIIRRSITKYTHNDNLIVKFDKDDKMLMRFLFYRNLFRKFNTTLLCCKYDLENFYLHFLNYLFSFLNFASNLKTEKKKEKSLYFDEILEDDEFSSKNVLETQNKFGNIEKINEMSNDDLFNMNLLGIPHKNIPKRNKNLKKITESSKKTTESKNQKVLNFTKNTKKIDFTFKKLNKDNNVLKEVNVNINQKSEKDYHKELIKNTKMNSGYKNIIIKYTDKLITNHIKTGRNRKREIKFSEEINEEDVHNPSSVVPIIKRTRYQRNTTKNKNKEIVFIQNVDLDTFNLEEDF
ncbi:uncharacterized protein VNE69_07090 [Vairimorpha necatrix]|uniref:Uncharacterized protein n=1 Tax=Vairimorpha necatrix TaxID=6039 RepID=A0AAX4JDQ9_9MICR